MNTKHYIFAIILFTASFAQAESPEVVRGRYLVAIGGCNDCHTPQFAETLGQVAEEQRLLGSDIGFSGPWGVTYAGNLRLAAQRMNQALWLSRVSNPGLPPMPWPSVMAMTEEDKLAIYAYLRALGPAGVEAPASQGPGTAIKTLHIPFVPQAGDAYVSHIKAGH